MNRKAAVRMVFPAVVSALFAIGAPARASEADDKIESAFKKSYVYRTYLEDDSIKVKAEEGVVTLTGTVANENNKTLAHETAAGLPGVTRVDNQLTTKAQDAAENADTWMGRNVTLALLFHRNVSATRTSVEVKDGVVTLKGEASSEAQKQLTAEYARDIEGVKEVRNEMTVAAAPEMPERTAGQKLDDASVNALVKTALTTHRSTSALKTGVVTRDGEVTLTGIAGNEAEKSLVTKLVGDIHGVVSVNNEMTIQTAATK